MARHLYTYECEDCGTEVTRHRDTGAPRICAPCGAERTARNAREMKAKRGEGYWRHREAMTRYALDLVTGRR